MNLSQHRFRGARRYEARKRQEHDIFQLQFDKWELSNRIAVLSSELQRVRQELLSWETWWSTGTNVDDLLGLLQVDRSDDVACASEKSPTQQLPGTLGSAFPSEGYGMDKVGDIPELGMDESEAVSIIQKAFRQWRAQGPLGQFRKKQWLLLKTIDFPGYPFFKLKVQRSALASPLEYFDPEADINAIKFQAACCIQSAWKKARLPMPQSFTHYCKHILLLDSLGQMGGS